MSLVQPLGTSASDALFSCEGLATRRWSARRLVHARLIAVLLQCPLLGCGGGDATSDAEATRDASNTDAGSTSSDGGGTSSDGGGISSDGGGPSSGEGWTLSASNVGLARLGLSCDSLPVYDGPSRPPAGTTISEVRITAEELDLSNGNITLDRVCVRPTRAGNRSSIIFGYNPDTGDGQAGPVTIRDSDIDGSAASNDLIYATCAFRGAGSLYRNHIWGMGSGICYFGAPTVTTSVIEGNFVHGLRAGSYGSPPQPSHNSSATVRGFDGVSMEWINNRLESLSGADSGALFIQTFAGPVRNTVVRGNLFDSLGWNLVLEAGYGNTYSNMHAIDNRFVLSGFGVGYVDDGPGWAVWADNHVYERDAADGRGPVAACPGGACASAP